MKDFWGKSKVDYAIELLKKHEPPEGYYLAFSGGKDSVCIYWLAEMAGVNYDPVYNLTTVDPPEVVQFIRKEYPNVFIQRPIKTMWQLIKEQGIPPYRTIRYCCRILKEQGGNNRTKILGIRKYEGRNRKKRTELQENKNGVIILSPILEWKDEDVWWFIKDNGFPYLNLYDRGWKRVGCLLCPMASVKERKRQAKLYPKYAEAYRRACIRAYDPSIATSWKDGNDMYESWMSGKGKSAEIPWF